MTCSIAAAYLQLDVVTTSGLKVHSDKVLR